MPALQPGDRAPNFTATTQTGQLVSLDEFLDRQAVVVFFYPRDGTLICTREACAFRDNYEEFVRAGAAVIGISSDTQASHQQFAEQQRLPFYLLSDTDGALRRAFGVSNTWGLVPGRVTFVIDTAGIVRHVFSALFQADRHVTEALEVVRQLMLAG